jgi:hypothetical protein
MKTILSILLFTSCVLIAKAQDKKLFIEIPRANYSEIEVTSETEKYTLTFSDKTLIGKGARYDYDRGKGGEKDANGYRERHKHYLKNANNDTIATVIEDEHKIMIAGTVIDIKRVENGWEYLSESGKNYANLTLFWNKDNWKYELTTKADDDISKTLEKAILVSLIDKAKAESKCESNDDDSDLWFSLYLLSIANNK